MYSILSLLLCIPFHLLAVSSMSQNCTHQAEVSVVDIFEESGDVGALSKRKVLFKLLNNKSNTKIKNPILMDILKHGPFEVTLNQNYYLSFENNSLCWLEKISKVN